MTTPLDKKNLKTDLANIGVFIGISRDLSKRVGLLHESYLQFETVLERLTRDGYLQTARDYAEEAICCAHADEHPEYGHYCRFALATLQYNSIDAAIHGCLLINAINKKTSIPKDFQFRVMTVIFTFFRNFKMYGLAESINDAISSNFKLNSYDEQKIQMGYLNLLLLQNPEKALIIANEYASKKIEEIKKFGVASAVPWLSLICNLKGQFPYKFEESDGLVLLEKNIESILPKNQIDLMRDMILPNRKDTKNVLMDMMDKLHLTRNKTDHIHEIRRLQLTASRLLEGSLESNDLEGIVLSHRAMSDGSLAFNLSDGLPSDFLIPQDNDTLLKFNGMSSHYYSHIKDFLRTSKDYRHLWLGFSGNDLYFVLHDNGEFIESGKVPKIKKTDIFQWLKNHLPELAFDDSPVPKSILETHQDIWNDQSSAIKENLPKIKLPHSNKHTIVFCDTEMSCFPHNFIIEPTGSKCLQAFCNPLSLDNYITYNKNTINIKKISVWAPLVEEDNAIFIAYERLKSHLNNENVVLSEGLLPEFSEETDLKAFICHGGRAINGGFTGLYPSNNKKYKSTSILGKGKVAILFICHGGHIQSDIYSRSFQTLAKNLLQEGYETVIAPSWSLNIVIPGPWMEEFLNHLSIGANIIDACLAANNKIMELFPVESAWAAMHIFGNPNIKIANISTPS